MVSFEESADETVTPPSVAAKSCGDNDSILQFGRHRLHPTLVEALAGSYGTFTDIQTKAIPQALAGKDILVKAQTGRIRAALHLMLTSNERISSALFRNTCCR
ncbi:-ATP-dependent RNA helicase DBP9 [Babesia bigemina]|uniref:-ATP-dependent RNA helicase DBP9 n=1 Tax=Babesia bigemina TaxID=5866 RepID=A0A061DBP0_BABBI|nr:-ATP-dependent RNA helicase DBP9 [Babesia bigemina]XP_012770166.1 -ATP-dependent RNA helicase DBP9 [Babesia bigemina]XP_012770168.1 -ATP-dependent RNA helicase DBP9 [Babesia bigemina]CDR97978.1 -ATP-dependent RNA helicase DBP9 [Babesia bigemina]CDR97980.1 -ATP-dependent RNA helicase DBP9 [Babesia bigemina]CDR97982.1 -ATP-dependent RNA helicase DBP9 [Babesia bigemina]|eukprot:XP_012770164.1 -ATP-dependent RNA helicase DBP9 [Babesia bigemina]